MKLFPIPIFTAFALLLSFSSNIPTPLITYPLDFVAPQSTPDYLLIVGPNPVTHQTTSLPVAQFTTNVYSLCFWFKINKSYTQKLVVHDYLGGTTTGQALPISYTANRLFLSASTFPSINPAAWNFLYIGVNCTAGKVYTTTIIAGVNYNESTTLNSTTYNNTCFTSSLSTLSITIGDTSLASQNMGNFSNFRYFPATLVTQTSFMRFYISQEIDPWLWLRFPPSEVNQTAQKLRDYARGNLVLKGYGYNIETVDSTIVMAPNENYTYGNVFTDTTYTTAYVDYLGPSFTLTMWVALNPQNPITTQRVIAKIDDNAYPRKSQLLLGLHPVSAANLQYSFYLIIANETTQTTFLNASNVIQFANSSDPNITEWLLIIFKLIQSNDLTPNFLSWQIYDRTGTLRTGFKSNATIAFTGDNPLLVFGGFNGYMTDIRTYKGTGATLTSSNSQLTTIIPNCNVAIGALYMNLTADSTTNTTISSSITCLSCASGTYSRLEVPTCSSSCYTSFDGDPTTNLCKCTGTDCLTELQCDSTCRRCNGISRESCRTCVNGLYLSPSPSSCASTCPDNYCRVYDLTKGGVCSLCKQYEPEASLIVINGSFVQLQFTNNMNITGDLGSYLTINMIDYRQGTDYDVTFQQISNKSYYMIFTYYSSLPLRALEVTLNTTTLMDQNGYNLNSDSSLVTADLPSIFSMTSDQVLRNDTYRSWALYLIYFMCACFPILLYTGDLGIFWGFIDSAQVLNYLLYINFTIPVNVSNFLSALSFANLQFFPNLIWQLIEAVVDPLDLSDQGAPDNLVDNDILYVTFLYNAGRVLSIFVIILIIYLVVVILYSIDFESEATKAFVKKVRSWVLFMAIRMFLVGFLQIVFAVILQINYPSYKDVFSMVSVVLALVFACFVVWMPINLIVGIERMRKAQLLSNGQTTSYSYLRSVIREYRLEYFISRNFVFFLLIRNIALVVVLIYLPSYPLTQIGTFLYVSLLVSLWIAAMPIYTSSSYTIINLVTLLGFGVVGILVFWMIGNSTFNDAAELDSYNYELGEVLQITSLVILFMYTIHVIFQVLRIGWLYWIKFLTNREKKRKEEKSRIELELVSDTSRSKISLLEGVSGRTRSARGTRLNDSLLSQDISVRRLSRKQNSRLDLDTSG